MKTRGVFPVLWILLAPLALTSACSTVGERSAGSGPVLRGSLGEGRVRSIRMQLSQAQSRIQELETALEEQSKEDGGRVASLAARERELTAELGETKARAVALESQLKSAETALASAQTEVAAVKSELAKAEAATAAAVAAGDSAAAEQVASLKVELDGERTRRRDVEEELSKLREETSAGPYESASATALKEAQSEIEQLKKQLATERGERDELEKRFAELTVKLEQQPEPVAAAPDPEMAALQQDQARLMAAIQQDLEASKRREEELRGTLAALQTAESDNAAPSGVLVEQVKDLESENQALQASLDAEHERNVELAAKLEVATRVADLIFKMRREGRVPSAEAVEEAAGQ